MINKLIVYNFFFFTILNDVKRFNLKFLDLFYLITLSHLYKKTFCTV